MRNIAKVFAVTGLVIAGLVLNGCSSGASEAKDQMVAATVNGRNIMMQEVERAINQQTARWCDGASLDARHQPESIRIAAVHAEHDADAGRKPCG